MKKILLSSFTLLLLLNCFGQADTSAIRKKGFSFDKVRKTHAIFTDEIGGLFGIGGLAKGKMWFSYQSVSSYQFDPHAYFGIGFGVEAAGKTGVMLDEGGSKTAVMFPLFGELRASFLSKRVSPYLSQKAGYSFYGAGPKPRAEIIGGAMIETQLGIKTFISTKAAFNLSVGYRLQCLAVPPAYASQYSDVSPVLSAGSVTPAKKVEYYNYLSVHAGFTY